MVLVGAEGKLGVDNIKRLFSILLSIYSQVKQIIKDFSFGAVLNLGMEIIKYKDDLDIFKQAWNEVKDLEVDDGELAEITAHLSKEAERLGMKNVNVLMAVNEALNFIGDVFDLWEHGKEVYEKGIIIVDRIRSILIKDKIDT